MPYGVDFGRIPVQLTLGCQGNQKWLDKWVPEDVSAPPTRLKPTVQGPVVSKARLEALVNDMKTWRQDLARSEGNIQKLSQFHLLPDKAISKVRSKIRSIQTESDLKKVLRLVGYHFPGAFITDHIPDQCYESRTMSARTSATDHAFVWSKPSSKRHVRLRTVRWLSRKGDLS
jgi:hypothetical protein